MPRRYQQVIQDLNTFQRIQNPRQRHRALSHLDQKYGGDFLGEVNQLMSSGIAGTTPFAQPGSDGSHLQTESAARRHQAQRAGLTSLLAQSPGVGIDLEGYREPRAPEETLESIDAQRGGMAGQPIQDYEVVSEAMEIAQRTGRNVYDVLEELAGVDVGMPGEGDPRTLEEIGPAIDAQRGGGTEEAERIREEARRIAGETGQSVDEVLTQLGGHAVDASQAIGGPIREFGATEIGISPDAGDPRQTPGHLPMVDPDELTGAPRDERGIDRENIIEDFVEPLWGRARDFFTDRIFQDVDQFDDPADRPMEIGFPVEPGLTDEEPTPSVTEEEEEEEEPTPSVTEEPTPSVTEAGDPAFPAIEGDGTDPILSELGLDEGEVRTTTDPGPELQSIPQSPGEMADRVKEEMETPQGRADMREILQGFGVEDLEEEDGEWQAPDWAASLMAMGLTMAASNNPDFAGALAEGGLAGLKTHMQQQQARAEEARQRRRERMDQARFGIEALTAESQMGLRDAQIAQMQQAQAGGVTADLPTDARMIEYLVETGQAANREEAAERLLRDRRREITEAESNMYISFLEQAQRDPTVLQEGEQPQEYATRMLEAQRQAAERGLRERQGSGTMGGQYNTDPLSMR
jgi:hypothetical protein